MIYAHGSRDPIFETVIPNSPLDIRPTSRQDAPVGEGCNSNTQEVEQIAVADRDQLDSFTPTTLQSSGG